MRTSALKKDADETPAGSTLPESVRLFPNPKAEPRAVAALSTFGGHAARNSGNARQRAVAYMLAALFEIAVLGAVWVLLEQPDKNPDRKDDDDITMIEAPPQPPPPQPLSPPPKVELPKIATRIVIPMLRPPPLIVPRVPPPPDTMTPPQPPPPPPPQVPSVSAEQVDRFQGEVRAAIQAAVVYPAAAKMMKQQGRAKVAFTLEHGHAEGARIVLSSGNPALDTAAMAAVRDAAYPAPPPELTGRVLQFAVFVEFNLSGH